MGIILRIKKFRDLWWEAKQREKEEQAKILEQEEEGERELEITVTTLKPKPVNRKKQEQDIKELKMPVIIKKGTSASAFRLKNDKVITCEPNILTFVEDKDWEELMKEYGSFIEPRTITDKNPSGCFIIQVNKSKDYLNAMNEEVGEVIDPSSPVNVETGKRVVVTRGRKKKAK